MDQQHVLHRVLPRGLSPCRQTRAREIDARRSFFRERAVADVQTRTTEAEMATVTAQMAMSIDGFIAYTDDNLEGYSTGTSTAGRSRASARGRFQMQRAEREVVRARRSTTPARTSSAAGSTSTPTAGTACRRRGAMVVVTHNPPAEWPRGGVPITFVSDIADAVAEAKDDRGRQAVGGRLGARARECSTPGCSTRLSSASCRSCWGAGSPGSGGRAGRRAARGSRGDRGARRDASALPRHALGGAIVMRPRGEP